MTYDVTTVKGCPILLEIGLSFLAQGQIFIFLPVHVSQENINQPVNVSKKNIVASRFWKYFNA